MEENTLVVDTDIGIPSEEELQPILDIIHSVNEVRKTDTELMEIVNIVKVEFKQ